MKTHHPHLKPGFTLVEVLVVVAVVAGLAAVAMTALRSARVRAAELNDLARLRNLGVALHGWAVDHHGRFPRSSHSATGRGELGWQREILPLLGQPDTSRESLARVKPEQFGVDHQERPVRSPALNVYFELDPQYDDYDGAPQTWANLSSIPHPAATILLVNSFGTADHVMAQYFSSQANGYPAPRPGRRTGGVLWVDGHATLEAGGSLFDPARHLDRFHPAKAR